MQFFLKKLYEKFVCFIYFTYLYSVIKYRVGRTSLPRGYTPTYPFKKKSLTKLFYYKGTKKFCTKQIFVEVFCRKFVMDITFQNSVSK